MNSSFEFYCNRQLNGWCYDCFDNKDYDYYGQLHFDFEFGFGFGFDFGID
jgi:hypothetical protein